MLPDEYFTPTAADLKAAQSTLAARTQALVNAPLQLRTVREAETKAKRDRWPQVHKPHLIVHGHLTVAADQHSHQIYRPHTAGEVIPVDKQDQDGVRIRA